MINLKPLSQRNNEWKGIILGFNTNPIYSIGGYGCLITCLAMAANWYGKRTDSKKLNKKLKEIDGFVNGGYYIWNSLTRIYPEILERRRITSTPLNLNQVTEIKGWLDKGYPVMLMVDMYPETAPVDMHFVLLVGYSDNDWTIADPWTGNLCPISDYLGKFAKTFEQCVEQYIGLISEPPSSFLSPLSSPSNMELLEDKISVLEAKLEASGYTEELLIKKINELDKNYALLETKYVKETKDLAEQRDDCENAKKKLAKDSKITIEDLENRVLNLQKPEITKLKKGDEMKVTNYWDKLPKSAKVLAYVSISSVLAEFLIELTGIEQTFLVRALSGIINVIIVSTEKELIPAIRVKLGK